jgi:hypothetical protein
VGLINGNPLKAGFAGIIIAVIFKLDAAFEGLRFEG